MNLYSMQRARKLRPGKARAIEAEKLDVAHRLQSAVQRLRVCHFPPLFRGNQSFKNRSVLL